MKRGGAIRVLLALRSRVDSQQACALVQSQDRGARTLGIQLPIGLVVALQATPIEINAKGIFF